MKFFVLLVALPLASATLSECEKEFLKNCRKCDWPSLSTDVCPIVGYDCEGTSTDNFNVTNGQFGRDCDSLRCKDEGAILLVDGVPYSHLACKENIWHFGKHYTLTTTNAVCVKRCDKCSTYPVNKSRRATIEPPVIGKQCASAVCAEGYEMFGKPAVDGEPEKIETTVACTGEGVWVDEEQAKYNNVYCVAIPPPPIEE